MITDLFSAALPDRVSDLHCMNPVAGLFPHGILTQSHSRAEACASVENIFFSHSLSSVRETGDLDFMLRSCTLGATSFNFIRYGTEIDVSTQADQADRYVVVAPLSGNCAVKYLGQNHCVQPGGFVILRPEAPFDFSMSKDHSHIAIGITRPALLAVMNRNFNACLKPRNFVLPAAGAGFDAPQYTVLSFLAFVCEQLRNPAISRTRNPFASIIEQTFISLLLQFMTGAPSDAGQRRAADWTPRYVMLAERFMQDNLKEDISSSDIVTASGVPMRTL